jgi:hypothetical protein
MKLFETFCPLHEGRHFEKDKLGFIRQLINILFCGYRRLEIADPRMLPKPILAGAQCPASNKAKRQQWYQILFTYSKCLISRYKTGQLLFLFTKGN